MPDGHDRNKCALQGPFSPFTLALQDIRNKLITRRDHHKNKTKNGKSGGLTPGEIDLDREYLRQIISISIPRYNSKKLIEAYITFPIAACFGKKSEKPLLYYSGEYEYDDRSAQKTKGPESDELKQVRKVIEHYIVTTKDAPDHEKDTVKLENIIEASPETPTITTQYPQTLRKINGSFKATSNNSVFHVFLSCQPAGEECTLSASCDKKCWEATIKAFRESFMSSDVRDDLDDILKNVQKMESYSGADDNSQNAHKPDTPGTYDLLKNILSNIQADAVKLTRLPDNKNLQEKDNFLERTRRAFSVVFVLPYLDKHRRLNFRYVLTHEQTQILKNLSKSERLKELIENMEKDSFESLMGEVENSIGEKLQIKREKFSPKPDFGKLVERLKKNVKFDANKDVKRDELNRQVEEPLRTAIFLNYAFQKRTKDKVLSEPKLDVYMDSVNIEYGQAFLLDQIFSAKRPDVMISMVNHPLSKLQQCRTHKLIDVYQGKSTDKPLYPAGLHLLETLLLPQPLFLYPIYQHEAPILLCAFDAAQYSGSWQALKSMVDNHTEGIFSAIVSHELDESKRFFNKSDNITSMSIPGAADELAERLSYLLLRFCPNLYDLNEALTNKEEKMPRVLDHAMTGDVIKIDYGKDYASIPIPGFARKVTIPRNLKTIPRNLNLITPSKDGRHLLQYYVKLCVNSFLGVWRVAELSRSEEAHTWAHAINGELSAIQVMFDKFKRGLSKEQQDNFILPERYLAILKSGVYSLMNINRLKKQRDSIFTGSAKRKKLSQVVIESFLVALLRLLSDEDVYYRTSRERLIKTELLIAEGSRTLKDIEPFLKYFNNVAQLTLDNIEEIIKSYFVDTFEFKIDKCRFIEGLFVKDKVYSSLLKFVFMEIFFNQFKYIFYDKPEIKISIEGRLFDSDDFLTVSPSTDQPTLLIFSNTKGNQQGGAEIGQSFLLNIAKIGVPQYVKSDMLTVKNNSFSVVFPVLVRRE